MDLKELAGKAAEAAGTESAARAVLEQAMRDMRSALRAGQAVELDGLMRLKLSPQAIAGKQRGREAVLVDPFPELFREETRREEIVLILAVEKADRFSKVMARQLSKEGCRALVAEGMTGVVETVRENGADVVIMDSDLEAGDEIRLWLKSVPERSMISLIAVYREGENQESVERFRVCEDEFLVEPYELETLESVIAGEVQRIAQERKYFRHEVSFQFPCKTVYQQEAATFMEQICSHSGLPEEGQMGLVVAFREAVDNACRHGNRGRDTSLINVAYVLDREKVTVTVEDEGPGFDTSMYLTTGVSGDAVSVARQRHKEGRQGGLGIMLMLKSIDRLEYNREGNVVKLTKYLKDRKVAVAS